MNARQTVNVEGGGGRRPRLRQVGPTAGWGGIRQGSNFLRSSRNLYFFARQGKGEARGSDRESGATFGMEVFYAQGGEREGRGGRERA